MPHPLAPPHIYAFEKEQGKKTKVEVGRDCQPQSRAEVKSGRDEYLQICHLQQLLSSCLRTTLLGQLIGASLEKKPEITSQFKCNSFQFIGQTKRF